MSKIVLGAAIVNVADVDLYARITGFGEMKIYASKTFGVRVKVVSAE